MVKRYWVFFLVGLGLWAAVPEALAGGCGWRGGCEKARRDWAPAPYHRHDCGRSCAAERERRRQKLLAEAERLEACGPGCWYDRLKNGYCGHGCAYYRERVKFDTETIIIERPRIRYDDGYGYGYGEEHAVRDPRRRFHPPRGYPPRREPGYDDYGFDGRADDIDISPWRPFDMPEYPPR